MINITSRIGFAGRIIGTISFPYSAGEDTDPAHHVTLLFHLRSLGLLDSICQ